MLKKLFMVLVVSTCYIAAMLYFADLCYKLGLEQGFKDGQNVTRQKLSEQLNPYFEKCNEAMERLRSVNSL